ncbi:sigma factor-like helix-turn-helix DNA-binding protein [Streptomyces sp. NPDC057287]|uniref:sigma factor-like helix-turn-helix DNA-binding protein n=1 Tax=Streptomyces sp. NPDC057287 TaxID=3346086 RepID=UPI0036284E15
MSEAAVERALGDLAIAWSVALGSPHPAAFGWESLSSRVTAALLAHPPRAARTRDGLHRLLLADQADAVICHRLMELTIEETASLQGVPVSTVNQRLVGAADSLGTELAPLLGLRTT